jgi:membrane-bound lytic murein transglycosylase D
LRENPMASLPAVNIKVIMKDGETTERSFTKSFTIGRDENCDLFVPNPSVSRVHAEVIFKHRGWWYRDLDSSNGSFVEGKRVIEFRLKENIQVAIGTSGVMLAFSVENAERDRTVRGGGPSVTQYIRRYFGEGGENIGEHTRMIRDAYFVVQKRSKKKYYVIIGIVLAMLLGTGVYTTVQHQRIQKQKALAETVFYSMKSIELELLQLQQITDELEDEHTTEAIRLYKNRKREMVADYDQFLEALNVYDRRMSEADRIIYRVARIFGESEITLPEDFKREVHNYIRKWQTTNRLEVAIRRAVANGYPELIGRVMLEHDLPPQFFFLALQESDFRMECVGPPTRFGIAKGMWQFIPPTATRYGLRTGPLVEMNRYDPRDERFDAEKATYAAARYIRDIYATEAQASGLLVMGSYNWGEQNIRKIVRLMPENPRERNFWELLRQHRPRIPQETYDYVFYIFSATVIAENPALFGFTFNNPLADITYDAVGQAFQSGEQQVVNRSSDH